MDLAQALRANRTSRIALVGAGGKTTALFQVARQLDPPVLVTTTTHLGVWQLALADRHIVIGGGGDIAGGLGQLSPEMILITGKIHRDRAAGLNGRSLVLLCKLADRGRLPILIEADGAKRRPLKAPADHEPVIPPFSTDVVVCAGLSAIGRALSPRWIHRADLFSELSGLPIGANITAAAIARVMTHPQGGLKSIPDQARRVALLTQADTDRLQAQAHVIARSLIRSFDSVVISSRHTTRVPSLSDDLPDDGEIHASESDAAFLVSAVYDRVAAIVLAAGDSERFGKPKQLLEWRGKPFIRHVVQTALQADLAPVIVVTGRYSDEIAGALDGLAVTIVHNRDWRSGQSTSIQAGLARLPADCGAAIFLLADQPQVSPLLIRALVDEHARSGSPVVAPLIDDQRGNPVLFDRVTFQELNKLHGDVGGRGIFSRYLITWVPWHDPLALMDVDTPDDYQKLIELLP
jgi:molybdenum cofactor cytidylyltransferase